MRGFFYANIKGREKQYFGPRTKYAGSGHGRAHF